MIKPFIRSFLIASPLASGAAFADAEQARVQFCWAMGKFDHTIYYADAGAWRGSPAATATALPQQQTTATTITRNILAGIAISHVRLEDAL
jgi:hypothetical protein